MNTTSTLSRIEALLGDEAAYLLDHTCRAIPKEHLHLPAPDFVDRVWGASDRNPRVVQSLRILFEHGRLGGTGYLSILPIDHGIAHTAGNVFAKNPAYFDPANIIALAVEGGCSAVVTTFGVLGAVARAGAHKVPLILKINHDEQLSYPPRHDNIPFARVEDAWAMGCVAVAATIYFGSPEARRQLVEVAQAFAHAHERGLATILFCYLHPTALTVDGDSLIFAADLTGQANHLGVTIEADLIKQKQPLTNGGYRALRALDASYGKLDECIYTDLSTDHPIDLTRYQVANGYMGRCGLIHSGGASEGDALRQAVRTAVINKRGGGMGLLAGRKAFQGPMAEGVALLHAIQDVYLNDTITVA